MTNPAEGRQIPITSANKAQLKAFLTHLGGTATNFDTEAKLIAKIKALDYEEPHIIAFDGPAPTAAKPGKSGAIGKAAAPTEMQEPTVDLTIHTAHGPGGKRAVFVGVNGKAILIPRGVRSNNVKIRYLAALEAAIETQYEYDEEAKANLPREAPSYPHQVHRHADPAAVEAWHVWEAKEERRLARLARPEAVPGLPEGVTEADIRAYLAREAA